MNQPQLRDIHLPDASFWWPPAPAWWWLLLALVAMAALGYWWLRRRRYKTLQQLSRLEFERIRRDFEQGADRQRLIGELAGLLRRTLIAYQGRSGYAASTGDDWLRQLQSLSPALGPEQLAMLGANRYRPAADGDAEGLLQACRRWIDCLPRRGADDSI